MPRRYRHRGIRSWVAAAGFVAVSAALAPTVEATQQPWLRTSKLANAPKVSVAVAPGNWGSADPKDVQVFLAAIASEFEAFAGMPEDSQPINIRVVPRGNSPRVLYDRGTEGEYVIQLTARNQNWFQYAYQFSHELCHVYSHFDHKEKAGDSFVSDNQWFEESLCETASLFTLRRLAAKWADNPPGRQWVEYAPTLGLYADFLMSQPHRHLDGQESLALWFRSNANALHIDPYLREKNELVASQLLPLFEEEPTRWRAVARLNQDRMSAGKAFPEYLRDWYQTCAGSEQEFVGKMMAMFGLASPTTEQLTR